MREIPWPRNTEEARVVQESLRKRVRIEPLRNTPGTVAGVDAVFSGETVWAVISVFTYPDLRHIEDSVVNERVRFPYIPGYLSFREGPGIIKAYEALKVKPDIILFDGQGIAHPRGIGIASHVGVMLDITTIGCAKSRLIGEYKEPGNKKGEWTYLNYKGEKVGAVVRTKDDVRPLFVSPGHRIDIESSVDIVMHCISGFRIPEPLRRADHISKVYRATKSKFVY